MTQSLMLDDRVLSAAFPMIWRLLKVYVIIPFSKAVVERDFSKMNFIMTEKYSFDSINLECIDASFISEEKKNKKNLRAMRLKK